MTAFAAQQETDFAVNLPGKLVCCLPSRLSVVEKRSCVLLWGWQSAGGKDVLLDRGQVVMQRVSCCVIISFLATFYVECCSICCVVKTMIQDKSRMMHGLSFIVAVV